MSSTDFPFVVGIGSSAGGLQAIKSFFKHLPSDLGVPYIIVPHLAPDQKSLLPELIEKFTDLKVVKAEDNLPLEANIVYVLGPNELITILDGKIKIKKQDRDNQSLPLYSIDIFLRSLGVVYQQKAIGIILSGAGFDGANGAKTIKENGGLIIAQSSSEAAFSAMPLAIVENGFADFITSTTEMGDTLKNIITNQKHIENSWPEQEKSEDYIQSIISDLSSRTSVDFSYYKRNTLERRLKRRMAVYHLTDVKHYMKILKTNPQEASELSKDFLINVTSFFRNDDHFETLNKEAIKNIVTKNKTSIRAWTPACSSGEEAVSIAILFLEECENQGKDLDLRVFGSDVDEDSIIQAQKAIYPPNLLSDMPLNLVNKYFNKLEDGTFEVKKLLKDVIIFSHHNILSDPPFTKVDLISFRNCLIYFDERAKEKVKSIFSFSLNKNGYLFLGKSETLGDIQGFDTIDSRAKIFKKVQTSFNNFMTYEESSLGSMSSSYFNSHSGSFNRNKMSRNDKSLLSILKGYIKEKANAAAVLDISGKPVYYFGNIQRYIKISEGNIQNNFSKMIHPSISASVSLGLRKIYKEDNFFSTIAKLEIDGYEFDVDVSIYLIKVINDSKYSIVTFDEDNEKSSQKVELNNKDKSKLDQISAELETAKTELKHTINELETANEELQSSNEELMSSNEELQSTNEELQSVNEELYTLNSEYESKNEYLSEANQDLESVLEATQISTLFLDKELKIRKISKSAGDLLGILPSDVGRKLEVFFDKFNFNIVQDAHEVMKTTLPFEKQVKINEDKWFISRIVPYLNKLGKVDGVVTALIDITASKKAKTENMKLFNFLKKRNKAFYQTDKDGVILSWNTHLEELLGFKSEKIIGKEDSIIYPMGKISESEEIYKASIMGESKLIESTQRLTHRGKEVNVSVFTVANMDDENKLESIDYILFS